MSILEYNGGCVIAMAGKKCFAIATDHRLGVSFQTVAMNFEKAFQINDKTWVGLTGLGADVQTMEQNLRFRVNLYELRENREISPKAFSAMLSSMLYEKRFGPWFTEPIVAGLMEDGSPFLSGMDLLGAPVFAKDYVTSGTCVSNLHGMCEALYKPEMEPEELFEVVSQCLLSGADRDAYSGWGATVHIITEEGVLTRKLKGRQD
jgi:20S proteasome subunit beta 3